MTSLSESCNDRSHHSQQRWHAYRATQDDRQRQGTEVPASKSPQKTARSLKAEHPGHIVALDTVERFVHGLRRYIITCEGIDTRFAFAWGTTSHASKAAEEFWEQWRCIFPYETTFALTDNGSEWNKHFAERLLELQIAHYHTYPKAPKMNAHVERFNRTIQEKFIDCHDALLLDLDRFNELLMDWLLFYNTKRVHRAFRNELSPTRYLVQYEQLSAECKSTCGHISICDHSPKRV